MTEPQRLTEKSIPDLQIDDGEYRVQKQKLVAEKQAITVELSEINAQCCVRLPTKEFHRLQSVRGQLVKQLMEKEQELSLLNAARAELNTVIDVRKHQHGLGPSHTKRLVAIRDDAHAFSMDPDNHQKAREIAWKISQSIGEVLRDFFSARNQEPPTN